MFRSALETCDRRQVSGRHALRDSRAQKVSGEVEPGRDRVPRCIYGEGGQSDDIYGRRLCPAFPTLLLVGS